VAVLFHVTAEGEHPCVCQKNSFSLNASSKGKGLDLPVVSNQTFCFIRINNFFCDRHKTLISTRDVSYAYKCVGYVSASDIPVL